VPWGDQSMDSPQRWVFVRMALGILQMTGVVSSIGLIIHSGVNTVSLTCVVVTSFLTTVSVFLFGSKLEKK
jgi:NADH:ubiquinone oxidoreductase subunit 4 (subunit M)